MNDEYYRFVGHFWVDILALFLSAVVFAAGCYLAWSSSPSWMNRAGSLIVIIGVVVAVSRFPEWLGRKIHSSIDYNELSKNVAAKFAREELGQLLSPQQRDKIDCITKSDAPEHLTSMVEATKRRLKVYEIYLVVGGTFINGFGDYVVCLLKQCGP